MKLSSLILDSLRQNGATSISGFGTFYLKNANAKVDQDAAHILPPGSEIAFSTDFEWESTDFPSYVSAEKKIPQIDAEIEVRKMINYWNGTLYKEKTLTVEHLGTFFLNDEKINFSGLRTAHLSPDFYGLEQINISEIKNPKSKSKKNPEKSAYQFNSSGWWVLTLLIGIGAITYFGITQPEFIFGKKSFEKIPDQKPQKKLAKTPVKVDSPKINTDSIHADLHANPVTAPENQVRK
ncbi:hypothetical protein [Chryseobacterium koreense]|uniref:hypothetical protein n=1 Tax=Chryseobacterium koreense TaxID=232216 RepID=UPI0026F2165D|nr:hypothetical protein [Chryseobacterium koreense]